MKLGCAINYTALNDNNCDCPSCSCGVFECRGFIHFFFLLLRLIFHRVLVQHGEMSNDSPLLMWKHVPGNVPQVSASLHPQLST